MRRHANNDLGALNALFTFDRGAPGLDEKAGLLQRLREDPGLAQQVDLMLLDRLQCQHQGLVAARDNQKQLEGVIEKFSAPPWHPAVFITSVASPSAPRALVRQGANERIVALADGVDPASLHVGDAVYLARELNVIMARATGGLGRSGETCSFERRTSDGRLVVKVRDEEFVVYGSPSLLAGELKPGDLLRWDRTVMLACEKIERSSGSQFFLEETPTETFADVGGLGPQIERIKGTLLLHFNHADKARKYRLRPKGSVLLHGPSGTGKTLVAKALANWLARMSPGGRALFMNIKPASLHSMWYSQSEANYREVFRVAREVASAHPGARVVLFFDEVDSIGESRGSSAHMRVHDNVMTAFLAELDGLSARGNLLVVGATNRRDALDPALLRPGRLGDLVLELPRPDRRAARDIFGKHLATDIPYAKNGHGDDFTATRTEIIDAAVSAIFAPNGENELAIITFRDGKRRPVRAADVVSGAVIANITRVAIERACQREVETGATGLTWEDMALSIAQECESAGRVLTPANCRHHLTGLPHDIDVVNVEPTARKVIRPQRFVNTT